ncbi:MAG: galactose-1-phosphate uridylyltransferase [Methanolinea sp.]|nr:galactose-1-phosphate uridylyltransferase [Methanolinea sp.]
MFTVTEIRSGTSTIQVREEHVSGLRCKISPERLNRRLDARYVPPAPPAGCPFCGDAVERVTPTFPDGSRIAVGESLTFPNLFPFAEWHTVTVVTRAHHVDAFSARQIEDALAAQVQSLAHVPGYPSINWNFLPSAGASIAHPHIQGLVDRRPPVLAERYMEGGFRYLVRHGETYWESLVEKEREGARFLFGDEVCWIAQAVPLGEREVRAVLPVTTLSDFEPYIGTFAEGLLSILEMYRSLGTHAFNMSIFFDREKRENGFRVFCSVISRINPNESSTSDSAFMERIHQEPVILTLPEDLGHFYRNGGKPG